MRFAPGLPGLNRTTPSGSSSRNTLPASVSQKGSDSADQLKNHTTRFRKYPGGFNLNPRNRPGKKFAASD